MRFILGISCLSFMLMGCATTQESHEGHDHSAAEAPVEQAPAAVEAPEVTPPQEVAPADGATPAVEGAAPQAEKAPCEACAKGKSGEATWCESCSKGYVDGKAVKCKGCYKAKAAEGGEPCAACDKS